jgi:hypothetical protein
MRAFWQVLLAGAAVVACIAPDPAAAQRRGLELPGLLPNQLLQQSPPQPQRQTSTGQTQTFVAPAVNGVRIDWCAHFGRDCGKPAADLFCREMQFDQAANFAIEENVGARGQPTLVFGDGALCQAPECDGFRSITCSKTSVAEPTRTPRPPIVEEEKPPQRQVEPVEEEPVLEEEAPPQRATPAPPPQIRPTQALPPLKIAPLDPETIKVLDLGDIYLDAPRVEPEWIGDIPNPQAGKIPVWDDETVFKWHPSNPGMAETYDLRFYKEASGGTPLGSVKIPGSKNFARPTIEFLAELIGASTSPKGDVHTLKAHLPGSSGNPDGDLFWEVAGYKNYSASGVVEDASGGGESFGAEIAVSDRWPLLMTDAPNGYGVCGPGEGQAPEHNPANIALENIDGLAAGRPVGIDYVYDRIRLKGQFSLEKSPYAAHPKNIVGPPKPGQAINIDVAHYEFENLFIDWGDGTVEPLTLDSVQHGQYGRGGLMALPQEPPFAHRYLSHGTHTIRIFQVSGDDVQKVNVASLNVAFTFDQKQKSPPSGKASTQGPVGYYDALIEQQAGGGGVNVAQVNPGDISILQGGFPLDVANRAYVIYCAPVTVMEPKDEKAFGPLVLYSVDVEFDEAHAVDKTDPVEGSVSSCDKSAKALARLNFAGKGRATVTWKIDGVVIGGASEYEIGPSPPRSAKEIVEKAPPKQGTWLSDWVPLEVSEAMIGGHTVTVEIKVKESLLGSRFIMRPSKEAQLGAPPVVETPVVFVYLAADDGKIPKKEVISPARNYTVLESDPSKPCHLRFMVADGAFDVFLPDPDAVTVADGAAAGTGNLLLPFANKGNQLSVPISFDGWQVDTNGVDVVAGSLSVAGIADGNVNLPGLSVGIKSLSGEAGASDGAVQALIDVEAAGGALRAANGTPKPPVWTGEESLLKPDGDWYRAEAKTGLASSLMGWSGFTVSSAKAALDFSAAEGEGPGNDCGAGGTDWIGVRLDGGNVVPNLFHLDTINVPVANWVIGEVLTGNGLCGDLDVASPVPKKPVGEGFIAIKHLGASVRAGFVKNALYDMEVDVPILSVKLTGTGQLMESTGAEATWNLSGLTGPAADRDLGVVRLQASKYVFGTDATGWRVKTNAVLSLKAESKPFATVDVASMRVGMSGRIYFDDAGATKRTIPLSGKSTLGQSPVDLLSATLTGPASGAQRLGIQISTKLKLSNALPSPDVDATYQVSKTGAVLSASGPVTTPFEVNIAFPAGQPGMSAKIKPHYVGGDAPAPGETSGIKFFAGPGDAVVDMFASSSPIQSAFVLGYVGSDDYWMTLTDYNLGPTGVVLVAPILNLFNVNGGLGYHVSTDSFIGLGEVKKVPPNKSTGLTFLAGMSVGTPDHQTFTLDGQLKMTEVEKVRFDFTAWLLKQKSGSTGDFTGYFQYGGGSFDGQVWGGLSILAGAVQISAAQGAVDMHFGSGAPWHLYLGRREGPKIETTLLNLGGTSGYMMLSGDGYFVGSGMSINLGGSVGPFSASVKGWLEGELSIEPAIPRVSGSASGGLSVKGCAFDLCVGPEASVTVAMSALPIDVSAEACFEVDLWIDTVGACGHVSL